MDKVLRCDCGFEVRSGDEAELIDRVQAHALRDHGMEFTRDEVLKLAFRAELDEPTWQQRLGAEVADRSPDIPRGEEK